MKNNQNARTTYKMYKKGRFWVFAGITLATINFGTIAGQAATDTPTNPSATTSKTTVTSNSNQAAVTLKNRTTSQPTAETNSQNESATKIDQASVEPAKNAGQPTTVKTAAQTQQRAALTETPTAKVTAEPVVPGTSETTTKQPEKVVTSNETQNVSKVTAPTNENVSETVESTTNGSTAPATSQAATRASLVRADPTITASGTLTIPGGSAWTIDSTGVLTIHAGNVANITAAATDSWYNQRGTITKVVIDGPIVAGSDFSSVFSQRGTYSKKISSIEGLDLIDTSQATNMSYLFTNTKITDYTGVAGWKTGNVTDMTSLFSSSLVTDTAKLPVENWDVSKVVNFDNLFNGLGITTLDLSKWQVGRNIASGTNVSLGGMFLNCVNLRSLNVSGWDTSTATQIANLFSGDSQLKTLDISSWDLRNISSPSSFMGVFANTTSLRELTLGANTRLLAGVNLPDVPTPAGTWQNKAATAATDPAYTSSELVALYTGTTVPTATTTYICSPASSAALTAKDVTLVAGPNSQWSAKDSITKIVDGDGNELDLTTADVNHLVKVTSINGDSTVTTIDASIPNKTYTVLLTYTDANGVETQATSIVTVSASQAKLVGQASSVKMGPNAAWNVSQAIDQAQSVGADGQPLTADELATVTATGLDLTTAGEQTVTLSYTDKYGNVVTTTAPVTVIATQAKLETKPVTIVASPTAKWSWTDSVINATDFDGNSVTDLSTLAIKADQTPDLTKVGDQTITLSYTDSEGNVQKFDAVIHVVASKVTIDAKDTTVIAGPKTTWSEADNFVSATDSDGQSLSSKDVQVTGEVNTTKPGDYAITYTITGTDGNQATKTVTVHVVASQATVQAKDSQLKVGAAWDAADNLALAKDATGNALSIKDLVVTGKVDTTKAGRYQVTYQYTDVAGNVFTANATITVSAETTEPGDNGNGSDNGNNNGDGDHINEGNGGGTVDPGNGGSQPGVTDDQLSTSNSQQLAKTLPELAATNPASTLRSGTTHTTNRNLPRTNETKATSGLVAVGMGLLAILGIAGYRRRH